MASSDSASNSVVTIKDVASRAGVALSSVSRVLSGHPDVSDAMRRKVESAVHELGYEPDLLAQGLRRGVTRTVGFMLRDISNPLFAMVAKSAERVLRDAGYSILLTNSDGSSSTESADLVLFRRRRVDGLIISLVSETGPETSALLYGFDGPIVLLDREVAGLDAARLLCDHYTGVHRAVSELLGRGHRRIALVTGSLEVRSTRERLRAYESAFAEFGVATDPQWLLFGEFDNEFAMSAVLELLDRPERPTAIVAGGVLTTAGTLRALRHCALTPGRDVSVVALDGWPLFEAHPCPVALVTRDPEQMGAQAARLMLEALTTGQRRTSIVPTAFDDNDALVTLAPTELTP